MKNLISRSVLISCVCVLAALTPSRAQVQLLAVGTLDQSRAGAWQDLSGLRYPLENGVSASLLGGFGSGIAWASGNTFVAVPDRGPNAVSYDSFIDDTVSYVNRFHTIVMDLSPNNNGIGLPFNLTPILRDTTLLWSGSALTYGSGAGLGVGSGAPPINNVLQHFFTGRSDNFDAALNSGNSADARLDSEGIRVSNDRRSVFISDEYGPYIYQFDRLTGKRTRSFQLPSYFYVTNLSPVGSTETSGNTVGRTANKGMEGLAITPDGSTLVGIMQNSLIQDNNEGATKLLHIVTVDIASGVTHEYAYLLTTGSGVSEITALNNHEFIVDERDGHGRGDGSNAVVKQFFKIDLAGAVDISGMDGLTAETYAVAKTIFVDFVALLTANGYDPGNIPAKVEGLAFGPDVDGPTGTLHTLWVANDNDFLQNVADENGNQIANPNQFFVVGFTDADLNGSAYVPQKFR